ncbi:glycoside hydrolase family 36 protein [Treponema zioleckii]|uniref:glycoside hydrolase family 36 protein n=1 Tax=Treponema zioleckii TaxID=331680 RepID=UPI00168BBB15|nr:glycoside hydrolase family 36 protein [Treponema zioleckii]
MESTALGNEYFYEGTGETDSCNREVTVFSIDELVDSCVPEDKKSLCRQNDFFFYGSGWQSWGFGGEIEPNKNQDRYFPIVPQWKRYFSFPGKLPKKIFKNKNPKDKKLLAGCFIIYLRWTFESKNVYLALCSTGNIKNDESSKDLPPVKFYVDRATRQISVTVYADGKTWKKGDKIARIKIFSANDFFELRESIQKMYAPNKKNRFGSLQFLNSNKNEDKIVVGGWESWYNHYADINQTLISEDLKGLGTTENLIKTYFIDNKKPCVFQVDDGWEQGLGQWDSLENRFPWGMAELASTISRKGYVPGLWVAPFIIDWRTEFAKAHREWILRDGKNKPVQAGLNLLWGAAFGKEQPGLPYSYYCLDLSRDDVLEYLDRLLEKVVNDWGFRYIKLDFLFAGMLRGKFKNGGSAYEWYERAVKVLTKRKVNKKGENVAYLGCGMPFESSFNSFPLSRIGPDTKEDWDVDYLKKCRFPARTSAFANMQSTLGHSFWDQGVFINDPDVVFLRYTNISLDDKEKMLIALVNYLFASQIMHSDDPVNFNTQNEGYFTSMVETLYEKFEGEEFGHVNKTSTEYFIFNKKGTFTGFINLGDEKVRVKKSDLRLANGTVPPEANLSRVVEFGSREIEGEIESFVFEPHSISIYEICN